MKTLVGILVCTAGLGFFASAPLVRAAEGDAKTAPTLEGTWRWTFTMPDGTTNRPKLKFAVEEGMLHGTTSFRAGTEAPVTNILVNGDQLNIGEYVISVAVASPVAEAPARIAQPAAAAEHPPADDLWRRYQPRRMRVG